MTHPLFQDNEARDALIVDSQKHVERILQSMRRLEAKGDEFGYAKALEAYKMWKGYDNRSKANG